MIWALAVSVTGGALNDVASGEYFGGLIAAVVPAGVGRVVQRLREQARRLEELTWHLERERERSAHAAVVEERARIARELHDVVAHGVSVIAVQSDAAAPLRAIPALAAAQDALADMRRLLGVLREDGAEAGRAPSPASRSSPRCSSASAPRGCL